MYGPRYDDRIGINPIRSGPVGPRYSPMTNAFATGPTGSTGPIGPTNICGNSVNDSVGGGICNLCTLFGTNTTNCCALCQVANQLPTTPISSIVQILTPGVQTAIKDAPLITTGIKQAGASSIANTVMVASIPIYVMILLVTLMLGFGLAAAGVSFGWIIAIVVIVIAGSIGAILITRSYIRSHAENQTSAVLQTVIDNWNTYKATILSDLTTAYQAAIPNWS
jgi:positive regulator of sigma E activity